MNVSPDDLAALVGRTLSDDAVRTAFSGLEIPWLPEIKPPAHNDGLTSRNVEFGFEDFAYFHAQDTAGEQPPVLEQICFYAPRDGSTAVIPPPKNLRYGLQRTQVRQLL